MIHKLTDHVLDVIAVHETNALVLYSPLLSSQIPQSYAAHAFRVLQSSLHQMELLRLSALWDKADFHVASIPSAVMLIDHPDVLAALAEETRVAHAGRGVYNMTRETDPALQAEIERMMDEHQRSFAEDQARKTVRRLKAAIRKAKALGASAEMDSVRNVRDKHIAHSLAQTRREQKATVQPLKYGDERKLLKLTIPLIESLYCWVNGSSFDIATDSRRLARKYAKELWGNCNFTIPTR
ncbi:hypothetical protein [Mesorhizobium sp. M0590]|uniref:AbiU2 domain-containing protein n=1 Tax=unclassified Mesorhizobium TaxID=325217 RepID=UPI0033377956